MKGFKEWLAEEEGANSATQANTTGAAVAGKDAPLGKIVKRTDKKKDKPNETEK